MRLLAWHDGEVFEASKLQTDRPYVMQRIHTLSGDAYNLDRHIIELRSASEDLFGFSTLCGVSDARRIIAKLLELSRVGTCLSVPVVMRIDADGSLSFEVEHPTFGRGAYMRAKRDVGIACVMTEPLSDSQTNASIEIDALADSMVKHLGGERAIWVSREGNLLSRAWRPIFVYYQQCWFTPRRFNSVEFNVALEAIKSAGYKVLVRDIHESVLDSVDEIMSVDIMGISSFARVKNHRLLSSVTNRVAKMMEPRIDD